MFQSNFPIFPPADNSRPGTAALNGWTYSSNGTKRTATNEMLVDSEYEPPSKHPAYDHLLKQSEILNSLNSSFITDPISERFDSIDDDVELDLATEVAQTLNLNEGKPLRRKRKIGFDHTSENYKGLDEQNENSKRMRMDWDDDQQQSVGVVEPSNNHLAIKDKIKSKEVFLSDEVQSLMGNICVSESTKTPEAIIMDRILKQNSMALIPWKPQTNILFQDKNVNDNKSKPLTKLKPIVVSDDSDSDTESIIVENPNGVPISLCMEEDPYEND